MKFCYFLQLLFLINVTVVALNSLPSKESSERGGGGVGRVHFQFMLIPVHLWS